MHTTESDKIYHVDQDFYRRRIEQIPSEAESSKFIYMRKKLAWIADTRPGIVF